MRFTVQHIGYVAVGLMGVLMACAHCAAGLGTTNGKGWHLWTEGRYSVIVAHVKEITEIDLKEGGTHRAVLEPLVNLAGGLDPSEHPTITVTLYTEGQTSTPQAPPKGAVILAVLQGDSFIVSDYCTFMPGRQAIAVVDGLADPKIIETLHKLQDARAHPDPNPYGNAPSSRPSTRPAK